MNDSNGISPINLLIAEDFHGETEALLRELSEVEFNFSHVVVQDEAGYEKQLHEFKPDVILSPYSLPGTNAVKLLGIARKNGVTAPFILLAYDLSEDIAIDLLGEGIEDYILRSTIKRLPVAIKKALQRRQVQKELEKDEHLLAIGEELGSSGSFEFDIASGTTRWSYNMYKIKGFELTADISHENYIGHVHPEDKVAYIETYSKILSFVAPTLFEYRLIRPVDGKVVHLRLDSTFIKDGQGVPTALMGSVQDITQIKETQKSLKLSESSLNLAQSIAKIGSWVLNTDDNTVDWSDEMFVIHELEKQAVTVGLIRELTHPEDLPLFDSKFEELVAGNEIEMVYRNILPVSGKVKYFQALGKVSKRPDGIIDKIFGTVQEIDERFRAGQELEAKTVERDLLLSTAKIGIWHWTVGSDRLIWDERCAKIFDEFIPNLKAKRYYELIHPNDRDYVQQQLVEGLKTGEYSAEYRLVKNDETTFVLSRGRATLNEDGQAIRMDGIIIDMTDLKKG